jgi:hypothetical protein
MEIEYKLAISALADEAARLRAAFGARVRWPDDFKKRAVSLVDEGMRIRDLSRGTGIGEWMLYRWRRQACEVWQETASFSELAVVPARLSGGVGLSGVRGVNGANGANGGAICLHTPRGYRVDLPFSQVCVLMREGLL